LPCLRRIPRLHLSIAPSPPRASRPPRTHTSTSSSRCARATPAP
jgi:hypothetical protein